MNPPSTALDLRLRAVSEEDLPLFFEYQLDPVANQMAAFTPKDPSDRDAYFAKWTRILRTPSVAWRTLVADGAVAGSVLSFEMEGDVEVSYWLGRQFWGRGLATWALGTFVREVEKRRPLTARVAADNLASFRVLEKCGFVRCAEERGFANARGCEIDEWVLRLD